MLVYIFRFFFRFFPLFLLFYWWPFILVIKIHTLSYPLPLCECLLISVKLVSFSFDWNKTHHFLRQYKANDSLFVCFFACSFSFRFSFFFDIHNFVIISAKENKPLNSINSRLSFRFRFYFFFVLFLFLYYFYIFSFLYSIVSFGFRFCCLVGLVFFFGYFYTSTEEEQEENAKESIYQRIKVLNQKTVHRRRSNRHFLLNIQLRANIQNTKTLSIGI